MLIAISIHEMAHAYAAYLMGDQTAKQNGRLSLNPLNHIDWLGTLCLVFFKIGWAKPVPINPYMFKNRKAGIIVVSLAGPLSNFVVAILAMFFMCMIYLFNFSGTLDFLVLFFNALCTVSIGLGIFNLIPIPPLDGSKVLAQFLPFKARVSYLNFERFGGILLFVLIYALNLSEYLSRAIDFVYVGLLRFFIGAVL